MRQRFDPGPNPHPAPDLWARLAHRWHHSGLSYLLFRYRYLLCFTVIGLASILLELWLLHAVLPAGWSRNVNRGLAFLAGMTFSFVLNASLNFRVSWRELWHTFGLFAGISLLSFGLNLATIQVVRDFTGGTYDSVRLLTAGLLFLIGYRLHRRYTFSRARSFGLAVYANEAENPLRLFEALGRNCDHVHVDLIDESLIDNPSPVQLDHLRLVRHLWPGCPVALHVMSLTPRRWVEQTWDEVDWYLLHIEAEDDLADLLMQCRLRGKRVGVVWRPGVAVAGLLPHLPHVDFVMVLGIRQPGRSGQTMCPEALDVVVMLDRLRRRYGYEVMFDGGVKTSNVASIPAKYIVAASAVLQADNPIQAAHFLRASNLKSARREGRRPDPSRRNV